MVLQDHGSTVTPFWAGLYHHLLNFIPAKSIYLNALSMIDLSLLFIALFLIFKAFGLQKFCLVLIFLSVSEASRAGWVNRSIFRYDWFLLLILSLALMKTNLTKSFVLFLLSQSLRPVGVFGVLPFFKNFIVSKIGALKLFYIFAFCSLLFLGILSLNGRGLSSISDYKNFSSKYLNSFLTNSLGLRPFVENLHPEQRLKLSPNFASESSLIHLTTTQNEQLLSESKYKKIMKVQRSDNHFLYLALSLLLVIIVIWSTYNSPPIDAVIVGSVLSAFILSPPSYYFMLIGLTLLLSSVHKLGITLFFACMSLAKILPLVWGHDSYTYKWLSLLYLMACLGLILPTELAKIRSKISILSYT